MAKKTVLRLGILYSLLITIAFLMPTSGKLNQFDFFIPIDKLLHAIIHLILAFIWLTAIVYQKNKQIKTKWIALTLISCVVYGIIIEIFQGQLVNTRKADFMDVIANSVGTLLGLLLFLKVKIRFNS